MPLTRNLWLIYFAENAFVCAYSLYCTNEVASNKSLLIFIIYIQVQYSLGDHIFFNCNSMLGIPLAERITAALHHNSSNFQSRIKLNKPKFLNTQTTLLLKNRRKIKSSIPIKKKSTQRTFFRELQ